MDAVRAVTTALCDEAFRGPLGLARRADRGRPLLDPDNPRAPELLATLAAFLIAAHSVRLTAERLGVHKNTVRYRLTRIHELTGLDVVEDTDAQVAAHMSLTVLRLAGWTASPSIGSSLRELPARRVAER